MIENFKLSSSVLLEKLKDLEAQTSMIGERPQTANILSKISKFPFINDMCSFQVPKIKEDELGRKVWL